MLGIIIGVGAVIAMVSVGQGAQQQAQQQIAAMGSNMLFVQYGTVNRGELRMGPFAGLTEVLIPAGYITTVYDPVFALSSDKTRYVSKASDQPTTIPEPGLPFSLVFRAEPGKEDVLLKIASAYEAASRRRIPPPSTDLPRPLRSDGPARSASRRWTARS